ncbi:putative beta-hexosaminidase [Argopecten irradians]|uniref:putative beta-hexosaminidase n=1 Tax=Argopecten irradians TaxID=31199 RepID=UPI00371E9D1C
MGDLQPCGPVILLLLSLICTTSANVANIANSLKARYELINHNPTGSYYASITLTNTGAMPITAAGQWSLYICHENLIEFERFNLTSGQYLPTWRGGFRLSHVKGCMYKFTPDPAKFTAIGAGQERRITFLAALSISGVYDVYPNMYLADRTHSAVIPTTSDYRYFVSPFENIFQYTRDPPMDPVLPVSPVRSYMLLVNQTYPTLAPGDIIPTPKQKSDAFNGKKITIDNTWRIYHKITDNPSFQNVPMIMDYFASKLGIQQIPFSPNAPQQKVVVIDDENPPPGTENPDEWYTLTVSADHTYAKITGRTSHGIFNGFQSLQNVMSIKTGQNGQSFIEVPQLIMKDSPRFEYRGLLLDVASNFVKVSTIKLLLQAMALVKLNKLQLMLANDYAVRLEIDSIPGFHLVGSRRCHDENEDSCLFSQLGSEPSGQGVGSGYYSAAEYKDILATAKLLHIEIIPMWSFDSNMRASEIAMRAYSKATNDKSMDWSLPALDAESHFKPNLYRMGKVDPCAAETEKFIRTIVTTIRSYHEAAGYPLKTFSVGGEDTDIEAWMAKCTARRNPNMAKEHPYVQTKLAFTRMLAQVAVDNGITLNAFDNQFTAFPTRCQSNTNANCPDWLMPFDKSKWYPSQFKVSVTHRDPRVMANNRLQVKGVNATNITDYDRETKMKMFQRNGYQAIISLLDVLDFSVKQEPNPYVPGEMMFGRTPVPVQHVFSMWPEAMCCSRYECFVQTNPDGYVHKQGFHPPVCLEDVNAPGPLGIQAFISTRKIRTEADLFQLLFPRLLALAERAWHRASWENTVKRSIREIMHAARIAEIQDFQKFKAILGTKLLPLLDRHGVLYYMTPPGAVLRNLTSNINDTNKAVSAKTEYPGFVPQIKTDKMSDFQDIVDDTRYDIKHAEFRTRNQASTRFSRSEIVRTDYTDKYAREHIDIRNKLDQNSFLEYPILTRFRGQDDPSGVNSYALRVNIPLYFDKEFNMYFNKTGYDAFILRKPILRREQEQIRERHLQMLQQRRELLLQQSRQGAAAPPGASQNQFNGPMTSNQNRMTTQNFNPMSSNAQNPNAMSSGIRTSLMMNSDNPMGSTNRVQG